VELQHPEMDQLSFSSALSWGQRLIPFPNSLDNVSANPVALACKGDLKPASFPSSSVSIIIPAPSSHLEQGSGPLAWPSTTCRLLATRGHP
jgi:hypothetical protein